MAINCKPLPPLSEFDIQRFWRKVDKSEGQGPTGECWEWIAGKDMKMYGKFQIRKSQFTASRISLRISSGVDPYPLFALHKCDNPPCCRPEHLYTGTQEQNAKDAWGRGRMKSNITAELRRGVNNPQARFTEAQILEIRKRYWEGSESQLTIATCVGVSQATIGKIVTGKTWGHLEITYSPERSKAMPNGKYSTKPVLAPVDVIQIREMYAAGGITQTCIGKMFHISGHTVSLIVNGKIHKKV